MRSWMMAAPLVLALAVAGCGGGDADSAGPAKADYIVKADAICAAENTAGEQETSEALAKLGGQPTDAERTKLVTDVLLPNAEQQLTKLRSLEKPKDDEDALDAIYDAIAAGIAAARKAPLSLLQGGGGTSAFQEASTKARAFGMKVCGDAG